LTKTDNNYQSNKEIKCNYGLAKYKRVCVVENI